MYFGWLTKIEIYIAVPNALSNDVVVSGRTCYEKKPFRDPRTCYL